MRGDKTRWQDEKKWGQMRKKFNLMWGYKIWDEARQDGGKMEILPDHMRFWESNCEIRKNGIKWNMIN